MWCVVANDWIIGRRTPELVMLCPSGQKYALLATFVCRICGGCYNIPMKKYLIFFVFVVHMYASGMPEVPLITDYDRKRIDRLCCDIEWAMQFSKQNSLIEVKFIKSDPYSDDNAEVYGFSFVVGDSGFWMELLGVIKDSVKNGKVSSRNLEKLFLEIIPTSKGYPVKNLLRPTSRQLRELFPGDMAVRWCIGPVDWILERRVPGSVTLCPGGRDYALHYVPWCAVPKDFKARIPEDALSMQLNAMQLCLNQVKEELKAVHEEQKRLMPLLNSKTETLTCEQRAGTEGMATASKPLVEKYVQTDE